MLRDARLETRRELEPYVADRPPPSTPPSSASPSDRPVYERTYRIVSFSRQLALVTERFPASLFDAEAA